jgi:hypothetical protein
MLSYLDKKLFPDHIQVVELCDGRNVYLIHKNGSTTLNSIKKRNLTTDEISRLEIIDIFVRDPYQRFLSGVMTYAKKIDVNVTDLSKIINDVHFINNHFSPQLFWVINLQRFTKATIRINHLDTLTDVTSINRNKQLEYNELDIYFNHNSNLKYYLELDCVLFENFINQTVTFADILTTLQSNYTKLYNDTFGYTKILWNVLD